MVLLQVHSHTLIPPTHNPLSSYSLLSPHVPPSDASDDAARLSDAQLRRVRQPAGGLCLNLSDHESWLNLPPPLDLVLSDTIIITEELPKYKTTEHPKTVFCWLSENVLFKFSVCFQVQFLFFKFSVCFQVQFLFSPRYQELNNRMCCQNTSQHWVESETRTQTFMFSTHPILRKQVLQK